MTISNCRGRISAVSQSSAVSEVFSDQEIRGAKRKNQHYSAYRKVSVCLSVQLAPAEVQLHSIPTNDKNKLKLLEEKVEFNNYKIIFGFVASIIIQYRSNLTI
jgi:hypothetical protein